MLVDNEQAADSPARLLSLDWLTVHELPPEDLIELAADLCCPLVQLRLCTPDWSTHTPPFDLVVDKKRRNEIRQLANTLGVGIGQVDPFRLAATTSTEELARALDAAAELGAQAVNAVCLDPEADRFFDHLSVLANLCHAREIAIRLEPFASSPISSVPAALAVAEGIDGASVTLNIDALHLFRTGGSIELLASLPAHRIGYAQICDGSLGADLPRPDEEALFERQLPGTGDFPLREFVATLPYGVPLGVEVPMRSLMVHGIGPAERARRAVAAVLRLTDPKKIYL